jgi:hypothetical protein
MDADDARERSGPPGPPGRPGGRQRALAGLVAVVSMLGVLVVARLAVSGGLSEPIAPPTPTEPPLQRAPVAPGPAGVRLTLGGRQLFLLDTAAGAVTPIPMPGNAERVNVLRQGESTVLVERGERAWVVPAGRSGPLRDLGPVSGVLPAEEEDRIWLVTTRYGRSEQAYLLDQVRLPSGRRLARLALTYRTAPVAVVPQGVLAADLDGALVLVDPATGKVRRLAEQAHFVDAHGSLVAWLDPDGLHLRDLARGQERLVAPPPGVPDWLALSISLTPTVCCDQLGAFAPDGRTLVAYVRLSGRDTPGLAVVDPATAKARILPGQEGASPTDCIPCLTWSSDGWLFFFAHGPAMSSLATWRPGADQAHLIEADVDEQSAALPTSLAAN